MSGTVTPMFRQYHEIKSRHRDAILMFRMGDFYEMFYDDALTASRALQITLTLRGRGTASEAPMCGVPFHAVDGYLARLTGAGFKVALCEQMEDPAAARGLVRREVVRVVTPGTVTDMRHLEAHEPNSLAALLARDGAIGVAWVDLSTGDFRLAQLDGSRAAARAADLLARFNGRELLTPEGAGLEDLGPLPGVLVSHLEAWRFDAGRARELLQRQFGTAHLDGFGIADCDIALGAAGALLEYLNDTQKARLVHIDRVRRFFEDDHLVLDRATIANLELLVTQREGRRQGALLDLLDTTVTGMGGRLLKERLLQPLRDPAAIRARLAPVAELVERGAARQELHERLDGVADLERLLARLTLGTAGPRDVAALGASLARLPDLRATVVGAGGPHLALLGERLDPLPDLAARIAATLADDPPATLADGGVIRDGHDEDLDRDRRLATDGRQVLAEMESRERERSGIGSLKIRYNRVFGYFIEVSRSHLARVPADYRRKQTLAGAERFVTPELENLEERILTAQDRTLGREQVLFEALRQDILAEAGRLRGCAAVVADLDVTASLADTAARRAWCAPEVDDSDALELEDCRHPVVEAVVGADRFIPNDIRLDGAARQILILTGPNMGGKSTVLRQTALCTLLAQAGSFVPARRARIGVADRIFCRVGAADSLATGQSTFMVEMAETANILHHATPRSLVLLDEVGRGTATFDGLSIAWAVVEHLHGNPAIAARTLFATHYHELTELALILPRVHNMHMTAREHDGRIVFLHRLDEGAADQSYGIQVAALAGVPGIVVARAREILTNLESEAVGRDGRPKLARHAGGAAAGQMHLFGAPAAVPAPDPGLLPAERDALRRLRDASIESLTPLDALALLDRLKKGLEPAASPPDGSDGGAIRHH